MPEKEADAFPTIERLYESTFCPVMKPGHPSGSDRVTLFLEQLKEPGIALSRALGKELLRHPFDVVREALLSENGHQEMMLATRNLKYFENKRPCLSVFGIRVRWGLTQSRKMNTRNEPPNRIPKTLRILP